MSHGVKHFLHASVIFNSFITWPVSFVFFIYSIGALVLLGNTELFTWAASIFVFLSLAEFVVGAVCE